MMMNHLTTENNMVRCEWLGAEELMAGCLGWLPGAYGRQTTDDSDLSQLISELVDDTV